MKNIFIANKMQLTFFLLHKKIIISGRISSIPFFIDTLGIDFHSEKKIFSLDLRINLRTFNSVLLMWSPRALTLSVLFLQVTPSFSYRLSPISLISLLLTCPSAYSIFITLRYLDQKQNLLPLHINYAQSSFLHG